MESIERSQVRSLIVPEPYTLHESVVKQITTKYRLLKVFDAEVGREIEVPKDLGSLNTLKYFSIKVVEQGTYVIPKSIGMLENLETLDLTGTSVYHFPKEICNLRKLRHFLGHALPLVQLKGRIGGMTSLQTLRVLYLEEDASEDDIYIVIEELGKLKQLKELSLQGITRKFMSAISSSINKMQEMEKLSLWELINLDSRYKYTDLHLNLPKLRYLVLDGTLEKLPEWIPNHQNLVKLKLIASHLTEDSMKLLKSMPNLLSLRLQLYAYLGKTLHFQNEWFKDLKELYLHEVKYMEYIIIDKGALPSLKKLSIVRGHSLKRFPIGIQHLKNLEDLSISSITQEFTDNFLLNGGKDHWIFKQMPFVRIYGWNDTFIGGSRS